MKTEIVIKYKLKWCIVCYASRGGPSSWTVSGSPSVKASQAAIISFSILPTSPALINLKLQTSKLSESSQVEP